ncbi:hypothetical protein B0H14DRAFT_3513871 [Mycena olivaceomarginata]|nr:hypothetical protein B0H14DRAFT_3513871 [Mycena olivaceomarginata]
MQLSTVSEGHIGDIGRIVTVPSHAVGKALSALTAHLAIAHQEGHPRRNHITLGSAALGRGAADTPSVT